MSILAEEQAVSSTKRKLEDIDLSVDGSGLPLLTEERRGSTIVDMNKSGEIRVPEGEARRIITGSLMGCTAIGIFDWDSRGRRIAKVAHIDPVKLHGRRNLFSRPRLPKTRTPNAKAVIMTPGKGSAVSASEMTEAHFSARRLKSLQRAANEVGEAIGMENVLIVPYDDFPEQREEGYAHTLVVDVPKHGEGTIVAHGKVAH